MDSLLPFSPTVSPWLLGSVLPCHTQCHHGPLSATRPRSVTMAPCFPRALQCHNHQRINQAGKDLGEHQVQPGTQHHLSHKPEHSVYMVSIRVRSYELSENLSYLR
ncbi:unnamed protein product [Coccothraustes coccothraustes]